MSKMLDRIIEMQAEINKLRVDVKDTRVQYLDALWQRDRLWDLLYGAGDTIGFEVTLEELEAIENCIRLHFESMGRVIAAESNLLLERERSLAASKIDAELLKRIYQLKTEKERQGYSEKEDEAEL